MRGREEGGREGGGKEEGGRKRKNKMSEEWMLRILIAAFLTIYTHSILIAITYYQCKKYSAKGKYVVTETKRGKKVCLQTKPFSQTNPNLIDFQNFIFCCPQ